MVTMAAALAGIVGAGEALLFILSIILLSRGRIIYSYLVGVVVDEAAAGGGHGQWPRGTFTWAVRARGRRGLIYLVPAEILLPNHLSHV